MARTFQNEQALASAPIGPLMLRLAAPAVAAQLINVLYNIVDRIYIGHIAVVGKTALTGVGVTFPILTLISAFSAFAGMGGAPLASIRLGAGDRKGAEAILGSAVSMLVTMALVLTVGFSVFQRPLLLAFGASADTIGYATDYLTIYLLGTIFVQLSLGLNTFISAQGKAMPAMCSVLIGAVLNILLDPLFIFVFRMGVKGAALATILSQAVSAVWVVGFLCSDRSGLHICREHLGFRPRVMGKIAALGVAPFIMQSTESLVTVVLNVGAQKYGGDLYVASITILQSVMQIIVMPSHGITTGVQPIMSYNYGAKNYARVRAVFHRLLAVTMTVTTAAFLSVHLYGSGPGQDQPVSGPAAQDHPAGAPGRPAALAQRQRDGAVCRRAGGRLFGLRHHIDPVFKAAEKAAAGIAPGAGPLINTNTFRRERRARYASRR